MCKIVVPKKLSILVRAFDRSFVWKVGKTELCILEILTIGNEI